MLDRSLKDLMGNNLPFGGKIFLCSGDFRQIAPVVPKARSPGDVVAVSLRSSHLWPLFKVFKLTVPQRTRDATDYSEFLLQVGNGSHPETTFGEGREQEKRVALAGLRHLTRLQALIDEVYPGDILTTPDLAAERAILATLNNNVNVINDIILASLTGQLHELISYDEVDKEADDGFEVDEETLHQARGKGVPDTS
ncbi:uncharacterized protein LOC117650717 [Thrips palmi]|uniref:ATP-dependent DNA helicase n=1 Tax=Thrips palmi TaxID=161013 RepID=A0A6P8ZYL2_THRPL|nr:uncharacterized protein LOC117650717 [Thrips palmi]